MARLTIQFVLILAVALGSPVASCCRLASMVGAGLSGVAPGDPATDVCCACCEESSRGPVEEHRHEPKRCDCGPAKNLFADTHAWSKVGGADAALGPAPVQIVPLHDPDAPASLALSDWSRPPPRCSLVALHCALTI